MMDKWTVVDLSDSTFFETQGFDRRGDAEGYFYTLAEKALRAGQRRIVVLYKRGKMVKQCLVEAKDGRS